MLTLNPTALRKAKIAYNFGLSECNRVKKPKQQMTKFTSAKFQKILYTAKLYHLENAKTRRQIVRIQMRQLRISHLIWTNTMANSTVCHFLQ